jgi:hypothetical protein
MIGEDMTAYEAQKEEAIYEAQESDENISDCLAALRQGVRQWTSK